MKNFNFPLDYPIDKLPEQITETMDVVDEAENTICYVTMAKGLHHHGGYVHGKITLKKMQMTKRRCLWKTITTWSLLWSFNAERIICKGNGEETCEDDILEGIVSAGKNAGIGLSPELLRLTVEKVEAKVREECRERSGIRISVAS